MVITQTSCKKQKRQHLKRKDRYRTQIDFDIPQVPFVNKQSDQKHELLREWEDAS